MDFETKRKVERYLSINTLYISLDYKFSMACITSLYDNAQPTEKAIRDFIDLTGNVASYEEAESIEKMHLVRKALRALSE